MKADTYISVQILIDRCFAKEANGDWKHSDIECAQFFDNRGSQSGNGANFNSPVNANKKIQWTPIVTHTQTYMETYTNVSAELIVVYKKVPTDPDIMKKKIYAAKNGEIRGQIRTSECQDGDLSNCEERYGVLFMVQADGISRVCNIDPKIRMV